MDVACLAATVAIAGACIDIIARGQSYPRAVCAMTAAFSQGIREATGGSMRVTRLIAKRYYFGCDVAGEAETYAG